MGWGQWSSQRHIAFYLPPRPPGALYLDLQSTPTYMFLVTALHPLIQHHHPPPRFLGQCLP